MTIVRGGMVSQANKPNASTTTPMPAHSVRQSTCQDSSATFDDAEGGHEADGDEYGIDADRRPRTASRGPAHERKADHREALAQPAREQHRQKQFRRRPLAANPAHRNDHAAQRQQRRRQHGPYAEPVDQPPARQTERGAEERSPEVDRAVVDAAQMRDRPAAVP